jgi:hypothetical protein
MQQVSIYEIDGLQGTWQTPVGVSTAYGKYFRLNHRSGIDQSDEHRHLHQRPDHGGKSLA